MMSMLKIYSDLPFADTRKRNKSADLKRDQYTDRAHVTET